MKLQEWLSRWNMTSLRINAYFLNMEWRPNDEDREAAWELYVELLTRVSTQAIEPDQGDEATALASVHQLFPLTREVIRRHGRKCAEFTKIAVVILNQKVRPFTAKWHRLSSRGTFDSAEQCALFRSELGALQGDLLIYTKMLADMAGVEDLTKLEDF